MSNQNGASGGTLLLQNWLSRTITATKFWLYPILLGTKVIWIISIFYYIFMTGKPGNGGDYCRYYLCKFIAYVQSKFPDTGAFIYTWLDKQIRPEAFLTAYANGDPEAIVEASWVVATTHNIIVSSYIWTAAIFVLAVVAWYVSKRIYAKQTNDKFIRGSVLATPKQLNQIMKKELGKGSLIVGGGFLNWFWRRNITIPCVLESQSILLLGKAGQGKTIAMNSMLKTIMSNGGRAVVLCLKDGDYVTTHADLSHDLIYSIGDSRSLCWSFMTDITQLSDFEMVGSIFFPPKPGASGPWQDGAREIFIGLLKYAYVKGMRKTKEIYNDIFAHPKGATAWLKFLLETPDGNKAAGMLALPESPTAFGFFITVLVGIKPLQVMSKNDGDFSIRKYLQDENAGSIFVVAKSRYKDMLAPAQSLFLEIMIINHLDLKQNLNRRFWYFFDELPNLKKINKLDELLAVGRSLGSSVVIGSQSYVQLDEVYGEKTRQSICNNCNVKILFCIADPKTAQESSDVIGKAEFQLSRETISTNINDHGAVSAMSELKEKSIVLPSEISNLKMKELYINVPGFGTAKIKIKYEKYSKINEADVHDPNYDIETIQKEYEELQKKVSNYYASIATEDATIIEEAPVVQISAEATEKVDLKDELRWQQAITLISTDEDMGMF